MSGELFPDDEFERVVEELREIHIQVHDEIRRSFLTENSERISSKIAGGNTF